MKYYSPDEIASLLKIEPRKIYEYIALKQLLPIKLGSNYRISQDEYDAFKRNYYKRLA
ncbi:helix-turn-helix domain-containing protein [Natronospora cellulosivora (SeqCode)]